MTRKTLRALRQGLAWLACITWLLPAPAEGGAPTGSARPVPVIRDVALDGAGRIAGQFLDVQGRPQAGVPVVVHRPDGRVLTANTDAEGRFVVGSMSGGLHQIAIADTAVLCRCWTPRTAPPAASPQLLVVSGENVFRAQRPIGDLLFSGPVLIGLVIAAAIAIPIAVHNSQDDAS